MTNFKHTCPVCGYEDLENPAYDDYNCASFEICPCCGIEFGYEDSKTSHEQLRQDWISNGMPWHNNLENPPTGWDPLKQLKKFSLISE